MVNETENSATDLDDAADDPIAEDQSRQIEFKQQTQSLRNKAKERVKQQVKQQAKKAVKKAAGKATKKAVKKVFSRLVIQGAAWLFAFLVGTIEIWGPIVLVIFIVISIAVYACDIPGFSAFTSVGSLFSNNLELVNLICNSLAA